jgi:hypothetical protein
MFWSTTSWLRGGSVLNVVEDFIFGGEGAGSKVKRLPRPKKYYSVKIVSENYKQYGHRRYFKNGDCYQRVCRSYKGKQFVTFRKLNGPYTRMFVPDLIINDCVGIAPMEGPVGQIFAMRAPYEFGSS